jgi:ATP/maltotriose-dependent transcriptional regulator MalT
MMATSLRRFDEAEAHLRSAVQATDEQQTASLHMLAQRELALLLYVRNGAGDRAKALEVLDEVIDRARALHTPVLESSASSLRARVLARATRGRKGKTSGR